MSCSTSAARLEQDPLPQVLAGCYRLTLWPDEAGPDVEDRRAAWRFPPILRLFDQPLEGWPGMQESYGDVFTARSLSESGAAFSHPFAYWRAEGDSIRVGHPGALAGMELRLARHGADLAGWIRAFTDIRVGTEPAGDAAPVRASRIDCPATDGG